MERENPRGDPGIPCYKSLILAGEDVNPLEIEYFLENPIALREESETLQSAIVLLAGTVDFRFI